MAITGAIAAVGVSAYSANQQNKAADKAAQQQQAGIAAGQQFSQEAADKAVGILDPIAQAGLGAGQRVQDQLGVYRQEGVQGRAGLDTANQKLEQMGSQPLDVSSFLNPSMDFTMKKGLQAIEGSSAVRGSSMSGAAIKDALDYSQGLASTNYNNAVQQAMADRQARAGIVGQQTGIANTQTGLGSDALNQDIGMYNTGVNTVGKIADITSMQGTNNANLAMSSANVGAASTAAQRDPLSAGLNTAMGLFFSDKNLKEDVDTISDEEIDKFLESLNPKKYKYTEEAEQKGAPEGKQIGVFAQDLKKSKVGKQMVVQDQEGDLMVDVPKSVSALLASTASLNKRIKKLEGKK